MTRFSFRFDPTYRLPALVFGIVPATAWVEVDDHELRARFGPWSLRTPRTNISSATETGGFSFVKTAGPAHLSFTDRGVTFATNGDRGACISFHSPVTGIDRAGRIRHPELTVTVLDVDGLLKELAR